MCDDSCPEAWHLHAGTAITRVADDNHDSQAWFLHEAEAENFIRLRTMDQLESLLYQRNFPQDEKSQEFLDQRDAEQATYDLAEHVIAKEAHERD